MKKKDEIIERIKKKYFKDYVPDEEEAKFWWADIVLQERERAYIEGLNNARFPADSEQLEQYRKEIYAEAYEEGYEFGHHEHNLKIELARKQAIEETFAAVEKHVFVEKNEEESWYHVYREDWLALKSRLIKGGTE